jgi:excisionase family DNA binding protein
VTPDELRARLTITVDEVAEALDMSRTSAYDAVRRGEIRSLRLGRRILVPTAPLLEMLGAGSPGTDSSNADGQDRPRSCRCDAESTTPAPDHDSGARVVEDR